MKRVWQKSIGGIVILEGGFVESHRHEIRDLIESTERREKMEHPLERIIAVVNGEGSLRITTTYESIARRIGEVLYRTYKGDLQVSYLEEERLVRVRWVRD